MDFDETWQMWLRPEKTKPCVFPTKSHYRFREERKKCVAEALLFCDVNHAPLLPLSLDRFPPNFPRTHPGGGSRHMVLYSRKVYIKRSNFRKSRLSVYFRVPCLCSAYGSREMFCDAYTLSIP